MLRLGLLMVAITFVGCGPRAEVAKNKLLAKIDSLLGELDVKREEIKQSVTTLEGGIAGLRKAKIKAQVKADQIGRQITPLREQVAKIDATLERIQEPLASGESLEIGGNTYSPEKLKLLADDVLMRRKELTSQMAGFDKAQESLAKVARTLEQRQQSYQSTLDRLENTLAEIDAKTIALDAMKEASAAMGESEATLAENVANLEDKVSELYVEVEAELRAENEAWDEATIVSEIDSVDAFINATQSSTGTVDEIDQILGNVK